MQYILVKDCILGVAGTVCDESFVQASSFINFNDTEYFTPYVWLKFKKGDRVIVTDIPNCPVHNVTELDGEYCKINQIDKEGNLVGFSILHQDTLQKATEFWFINANGKLQSDYLERSGIDQFGVKYKQLTGNYFNSEKQAAIVREKLINLCSNR